MLGSAGRRGLEVGAGLGFGAAGVDFGEKKLVKDACFFDLLADWLDEGGDMVMSRGLRMKRWAIAEDKGACDERCLAGRVKLERDALRACRRGGIFNYRGTRKEVHPTNATLRAKSPPSHRSRSKSTRQTIPSQHPDL